MDCFWILIILYNDFPKQWKLNKVDKNFHTYLHKEQNI
jgi:hypothetical protein